MTHTKPEGKSRRRKQRGGAANQTESNNTAAQPTGKAKGNGNGNESKRGKKNKENAGQGGGGALASNERQALQQQVHNFLQGFELELKLEGLTAAQRAHIHKYAHKLGLKTRSHGKDDQRVLTMTRQEADVMHAHLRGAQLQVSAELSQSLEAAMPDIESALKQNLPLAKWSQRSQQRGAATYGYGLTGSPLVPPPPSRISSQLSRERKELPIYDKRAKILQLLEQAQVLIVNGATGSGKSTQLPQYLLEHATDQRQPVRVVVTQPRRIAAISVAQRISHERGEQIGQAVGYQIRMNSKVSKQTVLTLTTGGCMLRVLAMDSSQFFSCTTHLIIDEVHERDLDTDFLLLATKLELQRNRSLKLILMSATMDLAGLSAYFGNAPIIDVEGRSFDVRVFQLEQILARTGYRTPGMEATLKAENCHSEEALLAAYRRGRPTAELDIDNDLIVSMLELLLTRGDRGAVIIYLPGYHDMTALQERLHVFLRQQRNRVRLVMLHSQMDNDQQSSAFNIYEHVQLKIILSTNIGQTSITIPDLLYVIDAGQAKMMTYDAAVDASQLACCWISRADAEQRMGRAGRRQHGICYRLYSAEQFGQMSSYAVPEIMRRMLEEICLLAKVAAPEQPIAQFLSHALEPPQPACVLQSCEKLKRLGVLYESDERITALGQILAELPLDVHLGKCLIYAMFYRCFGSVSIIAAFYSVRDPFVLPSDRSLRPQQQSSRFAFGADSLSDPLGIIWLHQEYLAKRKQGYQELANYCEQNFLQRQAMDTFVSAVGALRDSVRRIFRVPHSANEYDSDANMVRIALTAGLYPKLAYIERSDGQRKGSLLAEGDPRVQLSRNSCLLPKGGKRQRLLPSDWILYLEKTRTNDHMSSIEHTTLVSSLMVALQCGKTSVLQPDPEEAEAADSSISSSSSSSSATAKSTLCLDAWLRIEMDEKLGSQLTKLRTLISSEFARFVHKREMGSPHFRAPQIVKELLRLDAARSGLGADGTELSRDSNASPS